jgi:hypothetical protein
LWDARGEVEREVLQVGVEEQVEVVKSGGGLDPPDERSEVRKNVGARATFLDDGKDGGRNALGAFVVGKAPDAFTILKDLIPVFWGWRLILCPSVRMTGRPAN